MNKESIMSKVQEELDKLLGLRKEIMELPPRCPPELACFPYKTVTVKLEPVLAGWRKGFRGKLACLIGWHKGSLHNEKGWIKCDRCGKKYRNIYS